MAQLTGQIRTRDRDRWWQIHDPETYVCPDCGRTRAEHGHEWQVHHIDRVPHNIVGLCRPCHQVRHGAERMRVDLDWWKEDFLALGGD